MLDEASRPKLEWCQRDRPLVTLRHVYNVGQTEGLKLRSLQIAAPGVGGARRVEGLIKATGVRVEHVAGEPRLLRARGCTSPRSGRSTFPASAVWRLLWQRESPNTCKYLIN